MLTIRRPGALGEIRTPDPRIRSPMLYPAELRALGGSITRVGRTGLPGITLAASTWVNMVRSLARSAPLNNYRSQQLRNKDVCGGLGRCKLPSLGRMNWSRDRHNRRRCPAEAPARNCASSLVRKGARRGEHGGHGGDGDNGGGCVPAPGLARWPERPEVQRQLRSGASSGFSSDSLKKDILGRPWFRSRR
jgi:hypothetical protein